MFRVWSITAVEKTLRVTSKRGDSHELSCPPDKEVHIFCEMTHWSILLVGKKKAFRILFPFKKFQKTLLWTRQPCASGPQQQAKIQAEAVENLIKKRLLSRTFFTVSTVVPHTDEMNTSSQMTGGHLPQIFQQPMLLHAPYTAK
jgi:hypothetical protein